MKIDRDVKETVKAELGKAYPGRIRFAQLDVTDEHAVEALMAGTEAEFGSIRGIVCSAGIGRDTPFFDTTADMFRQIYEINVIGTFLVTQAGARIMAASGGGAIVNLASIDHGHHKAILTHHFIFCLISIPLMKPLALAVVIG